MNFGPQGLRSPESNLPTMQRRGFTMAEVMIAVLFLSIAMFGYVALQLRILHSSTTLSQRHEVRRKVDLFSSNLLASAQAGKLPADGVYPLMDPMFGQMEFITPYLVFADQPTQVNGTYSVRRILDPPDMTQVGIEIQWQSQHGTQQYHWDTYRTSKDKGW